MDRKTFLKQLLAGGAALGAAMPLLSSFSSAQARPIHLPPMREHVRHGLLAPNQPQSMWPAPDWFSHLQRDRMFANGYAAGAQDLFHLSFQVQGQALSLSLQQGKAFLSTPEREQHFELRPNQLIRCHWEEPYRVQVLSLEGALKIPEAKLGRKLIFLPVQGEAWANGKRIAENQGLYFAQSAPMQLRSESPATLVILSRT